MSSPQHVYLSPHYDDASLSCGAAIYQQVQAGERALVITVCAAAPQPESPLSPFAQRLHQAWGNPKNVVATRQAEDQRSMELLGVAYHRLDFTDCIYRGDPPQQSWFYTSEVDLFGSLHADDAPLAAKIAEAVVQLDLDRAQTVLYAPLTVGHHVDHQLTHQAALTLQQQGWSVLFYEDYPYSDPAYPFNRPSPLGEHNPYSLEATLRARSLTKLRPEFRFLSAEALEAKIASIQAYASQLSILFGGEAAMRRYVQAYAMLTGQGRPAERVWFQAP